MTTRQFAGLLGILAAGAALIALSLPISADYDSVVAGDLSADCGSALNADIDWYSGAPLAACRDALSTRRAWGWPLGAVGLVVLAGALMIKPAGSHARETGPSERDSEGPVVQ